MLWIFPITSRSPSQCELSGAQLVLRRTSWCSVVKKCKTFSCFVSIMSTAARFCLVLWCWVRSEETRSGLSPVLAELWELWHCYQFYLLIIITRLTALYPYQLLTSPPNIFSVGLFWLQLSSKYLPLMSAFRPVWPAGLWFNKSLMMEEQGLVPV